MVFPAIPGQKALGCLPLAMLFEQIEERRRTLKGELALALALPKDVATTSPLRAFDCMAGAICERDEPEVTNRSEQA